MTVRNRKIEQRRRTAAWLLTQGACIGSAVALVFFDWPAWNGIVVVAAGLIASDRFMRVPGGVPVIVYHSVSEQQDWLPWSDQIAVKPRDFERHIALLQRFGLTIMRNRDFIERRLTGKPMPPLPVVIHLDDGYLDNWVAAAQILNRLGAPATIMVSLDFVEAGDTLRPTLADVDAGRVAPGAITWPGYMNWREIHELERSGLIDIEAHGVDHARVVTGPTVIGRLHCGNWRHFAWMQWAATQGDKSGWHRHDAPPSVPYGTAILESEPALGARCWSAEGYESDAAYEARVRADLARSAAVLEAKLGRRPSIFCWPENKLTSKAHEIALSLGYRATTGGRGENRPEEDASVISRVHAGDRALGFRCSRVDALRLLAACRAFQGNYYWCLPLFVIHGLNAVRVRALRVARSLLSGQECGLRAARGPLS